MSPDDQIQVDAGSATSQAVPTDTDGGPRINRYQLESARQIAAQKIEAALQDFATVLPQGKLYVQEAINAIGAVLDNLERRTHQFDENLALEPDLEENPDMAQHRADIAGVEESEEIKDFNMS